MISFSIPGKPTGKARARTIKIGITYTPEKTVNYENLVKICFEEAKPEGFIPVDYAISMTIVAFYEIPKSVSKKKRQAMLEREIRPTVKPDADNVAKIVTDALNKIAYRDDTQIVSLTVLKYYSEYPRVEVEMREVKA